MVKSTPLLLAIVACASGCDILTSSFETNPYSGDPYPIIPNIDSGALVVGIRAEGRPTMRTAVLDVLSPLTLFDRGPDAPQEFETRTLLLYGSRTPGGALDLQRAAFRDHRFATIHPCSDDEPTCTVGSLAAPRAFDAILGMDAFASDALRIRVATQELFIFPDIAGEDVARSRACDAVLPAPFRGGGTVIIGGAEVGFPNRRIAIDACMAPAPFAASQRERGVDALFVLSTAIDASIINESTYARYREVFAAEPELAALPESTVLLPSGPVAGRLTSIPSLALVGNLSSSPRAPCRQVYASHLLEERNCATSDDCPCEDDARFCSVPAVVEIAPPARLPVLVVSDANPTLQALRTELRPDRPEVDGILGTSALGLVELDIDYPHDRLLMRCLDPAACGARTTLDVEASSESRRYLTACLGDARGPIP